MYSYSHSVELIVLEAPASPKNMDYYNPLERLAPPSTPSTTSQSDKLSRRHACNRCRSYKVRCERQLIHNRMSVQECRACIKARVPCTTSLSAKMGRPRRNLSDSTTTTSSQTNTASDPPSFTSDTMSLSPFSYDIQDKDLAAQLDYDESDILSSWPADDRTLVWLDTPAMLDSTSSSDLPTSMSDDTTRDTETTRYRDDYLHNLSELNKDLLGQFHYLSQSDDSRGQRAESPHRTAASPFVNPQPNRMDLESPTISIGSILQNSERLLKILRPLLSPSSTSSAPFDFSPTDHLHSNDHQPSKFLPPFTLSPEAFFPTQSTSSTLNRSHSTASSLPSLTASTQAPSPHTSEPIPRLDFPTAMAFMSAYTTLSRIYRLLLNRIESTLRRSYISSALNDPPGYGDRPSTLALPRINLDNFGIEQDSRLQVKVLLQVCTHMWKQVESGVRGLLVE